MTGQLEAEFMALSMGDVYTFGPTLGLKTQILQGTLQSFG